MCAVSVSVWQYIQTSSALTLYTISDTRSPIRHVLTYGISAPNTEPQLLVLF